MSEMKCCPECSSNDLSLINIVPHAYIYCKECGYTGQLYDSRAEAISAWNEIKRKITEKGKIHTIVSYQSVNSSKHLDNMPNELKEQIIQKTQDKLMSDLSKALIVATTEGKYILIHPLTFSQHEDFISRKLEIVRRLSYEVLDGAPNSEEDV